MSRRPYAAAAAACLTLALVACAPPANEPAKRRITQPPDTGFRSGVLAPTTGFFAGGSTFKLAAAAAGSGNCKQKPPTDPTQIFKNPLQPEADDSTTVDLTAEQRAEVGRFLTATKVQVAPGATAVVLPVGTDASRSLPWTGRTTGGDVQQLQAASTVISLDDRAADLRIDVPSVGTTPQTPKAAGTYRLAWKESGGQTPWAGSPGEAAADCTATGTVEVVRTGGPPPQPAGPPAGVAVVREVAPPPAPGGVAERALAAINAATWVSGDRGAISLRQPSGNNLATGTATLSGGVYVVVMSGQRDDEPFVFRGAKVADGTVSGTLLAGGQQLSVSVNG